MRKKMSKFCVGGGGDASSTSLEQHVVRSSADGCQDTVGLVMLVSAEDVEEREERREEERRDGKMKEDNKKPPARSHNDCVSRVINRGLFFTSAAGASVTSVADENRKWRVGGGGGGSYPASPCKLLYTAVLAVLPPLWQSKK